MVSRPTATTTETQHTLALSELNSIIEYVQEPPPSGRR